ncbi:nucleotidyltransferase family protein [Thermopetrobacter sp. TC1]|uniref:nucleotidyltransferase family protein n=1 Tax=Thermopetrobacter sp. TC1 TaxID=1495045 RepID=UPI000570A582|nr:nucleotidyltransferase family protein [Thermopetrobacter sp. TC1]
MTGIKTAMALAAGLGTRMRPLTLKTPKPLIKVAGRSLLDRVVDAAGRHGVARVVVNVHWLADQIEVWAEARTPPPEILLSDEREHLLETGGGIRKALDAGLLERDAPFFVFNTDSFWCDGQEPLLVRLQAAWDDARMDCLAVLAPFARAVGYEGQGDFIMDDNGRLARADAQARAKGEALPFTGIYVVHPRLFAQAPDAPAFSMNVLFDVALARGRMYGLLHDGLWLHVGTPEAIAGAEAALARWNRTEQTA